MNNTLPENLIEKNSGFKRITKSSVILQNGEELPVDAIIYSTGYKYSFPFLPEGMVRWDKNRLITHFYKDIIPVEYHVHADAQTNNVLPTC
jgi:lysine/ornithine N-monooxygenase